MPRLFKDGTRVQGRGIVTNLPSQGVYIYKQMGVHVIRPTMDEPGRQVNPATIELLEKLPSNNSEALFFLKED